jgi:hypothetical protein
MNAQQNPYSEPTPQQRAAAWIAMAWNELDKLRGTEPEIWKERLSGMRTDLRAMVGPIESIREGASL